MIYLKNTQKSVPIDTTFVHHQLEQILAILKYESFSISLLITTDATIKKYNKQYRNVDKATDILSFPYHPELKAGKRIKVRTQEDENLGDMIISAPYVVKEARVHNVSFERRMQILLVHGVCHLLGYDHIEDGDWRRMRAKEAYILKKLSPAP